MENWPRDNRSRLGSGNLEFVDEVFGPESLEFDSLGRGPYAGLADGRVVRWMGEDVGWETFALVTSNWSEKLCSRGVDSTTSRQWKHEKLCGRPLGLRFHKESGNLYIADAYYGLLVVGPEGGIATPLATHLGGDPILFANDLDIHRNGSIFFTDTSKRYDRVDHFFILLEGESTGRLLRYDPPTKTTHVVLDGLAFPNGVQLSRDQTFIVFTETTNCRLMKYWLERTEDRKGGTCRKPAWFSRQFVSLFNENGEILEVLEDPKGEVMKLVSEVREVEGKLWIGTVAHNHIATLPYP
ncbi:STRICTOSIDINE SYNTHASE-RELATED [Salix koriyanagi]|uniref:STRICTOSIDINE SYNTHASE-RELATED n=1 Tax=Salix koriyanagi TaxID=2511006 RepID=A0A9Q0SUW8_9ROSI|nr:STRICTOSIDINE SYNTHASE-RELATED [Salix koriyanagi]